MQWRYADDGVHLLHRYPTMAMHEHGLTVHQQSVQQMQYLKDVLQPLKWMYLSLPTMAGARHVLGMRTPRAQHHEACGEWGPSLTKMKMKKRKMCDTDWYVLVLLVLLLVLRGGL